jgi:phage/plasmid-associated DNA primase
MKETNFGRFEQSFMFHMIRDFFLLLIVVAGLELAIRYAVVVYDFKSNEPQRVERAAQQLAGDIKSIMLNTSGGDAAKNMSVLAPLKYKRGAISNEPPQGVTLDGNFFKTVVSAGDGIVIRQNHENEYTVRMRCTFLINGNEMPKISPLDDAVNDRIHGVVPYNIRFTDVASELRPDKVKRKDVAAKDLFNDPVYQDAFLSILFDSYQDFLANGHTPPPAVVESKKEWLASGDSLDRILEEKFYITGLETDFIPFMDIKKHVAAQGQHYSDTKLGRELGKDVFTSKRVLKANKRVGRAMVRGYTGLIEIPRDSYGTSWGE